MQVNRLRQRNDFIIVAVAGSVGKTSTKLAIASLLSSRQKVIFQDGNYNDRLTVPLVLFGRTEPGIYNIPAWLKILWSSQLALRRPYPFEIAVLELGTDKPGELAHFSYLQPELVVITAVAPEHMEFFVTLERVAKEELTPLAFAKDSLLNLDDIGPEYMPQETQHSYGENPAAEYKLVKSRQQELKGQQIEVSLKGHELSLDTPLLGKQGAKIILAATAVADLLGWPLSDIKSGLQAVGPVAGRMNVLPGVSDSQLIDDTYNSSPSAAKAALDVLFQTRAGQRVAVLGDMNELGVQSEAAHREIGAYCNPDKLDLIVTIGPESAEFLAPAAAKNGCRIKSFNNPYEAGTYVKQQLKPGAVVLAKGSQNGVFAEEALKILLCDPADKAKLVRQSPYWLKLKGAAHQPIA